MREVHERGHIAVPPQKGGTKIPVGDPLLYIQVIPDVLPRNFKEYLADAFNKMVVPSQTTRECDYALYWGGFGDFEGTSSKSMEDLILDRLNKVRKSF